MNKTLNSVILNCSYWVRLHAVDKFDLSVFCIFTGESSVLYLLLFVLNSRRSSIQH